MTSDQTPPAGWYPDNAADAPAGRLRYWDGSAWTQHTTAPTTAPPVAASTVPTVGDSQSTFADQATVQQAPRNGLGIAALILGIIGASAGIIGGSGIIPLSILLAGILGVIGLILGVLGRGRAKRGEATNKTIAERGIAISTTAVAISVFAAVPLGADLFEESVETGNTLLGDLEVGDCLADIPEVEEEVIYYSIDTVSCSEPHGAEVYAREGLPEGDFPGDEAVLAQAVEVCGAEFESFVGLPYAESVLEFSYLYPTEQSWNAGDRSVTCSVVDLAGDTTGTLADANR